ncbi:MAG TPA: hypothetical protein VFQ26_10365 [Nitrospiraceae bacterium]|nr:hypothetical protein [Nitrospiraceae bacterium]
MKVGEEFSPDDFTRRTFTYYELPILGLQVTPIWHADSTNDLEKYLLNDKLIIAAKSQPQRWDLVTGHKGPRRETRGDALILCQYLDAVDKDGKNVWQTWSEQHTESAKILWPTIGKIARQQLYSFTPDLFRLAQSETATAEFKTVLNQTVADKYVLTAKALQAVEQDAAAQELFAEALKHVPDHAEALAATGGQPAAPDDQ